MKNMHEYDLKKDAKHLKAEKCVQINHMTFRINLGLYYRL